MSNKYRKNDKIFRSPTQRTHKKRPGHILANSPDFPKRLLFFMAHSWCPPSITFLPFFSWLLKSFALYFYSICSVYSQWSTSLDSQSLLFPHWQLNLFTKWNLCARVCWRELLVGVIHPIHFFLKLLLEWRALPKIAPNSKHLENKKFHFKRAYVL